MTDRRIPELLAPAGSPEALRAAVANGADAVYLAGKRFGARAYAENFTREELVEALDYAHGRGVKVYVAVNTLVDNREFD
ncbi:MAG: peptidase U32 family protein, partial [Thermacetogeniaceae bacterium]